MVLSKCLDREVFCIINNRIKRLSAMSVPPHHGCFNQETTLQKNLQISGLYRANKSRSKPGQYT